MPCRITFITALFCSLLLPASAGASATHVPAPRHNWIELLPPRPRSTWLCILWRESRSTLHSLNLTDNNAYGSSGIFQIEPSTWDEYRARAHVPTWVQVWQASVTQQFSVARQIWLADGFAPWHTWDGC